MANSNERSPSSVPPASRRAEERIAVVWPVDCAHKDTFLYAYITNVSSLGVFVRTEQPLPIGTQIHLRFAPKGLLPFELFGEVAWINPYQPDGPNLNPGMGIRFLNLSPDDRERLVEAIHTIAYVRSS